MGVSLSLSISPSVSLYLGVFPIHSMVHLSVDLSCFSDIERMNWNIAFLSLSHLQTETFLKMVREEDEDLSSKKFSSKPSRLSVWNQISSVSSSSPSIFKKVSVYITR